MTEDLNTWVAEVSQTCARKQNSVCDVGRFVMSAQTGRDRGSAEDETHKRGHALQTSSYVE